MDKRDTELVSVAGSFREKPKPLVCSVLTDTWPPLECKELSVEGIRVREEPQVILASFFCPHSSQFLESAGRSFGLGH